MRRYGLMFVLVLALVLAACHESGEDTTVAGDASCNSKDVTAKEGDTVDMGCLTVSVPKAEFAAFQLNANVIVENKSDKTLNIKPSLFSATDSTKTAGLPTTCGGTGGFSGELAKGEKIDSHICWFIVGATPPITLQFSVPGSGVVSFTLAAQ